MANGISLQFTKGYKTIKDQRHHSATALCSRGNAHANTKSNSAQISE
jgi:hypothetical protein